MAAATFDASYYQANYRDYERQNPPRKLRFYRRHVEAALAPGLPRRIHDVGCAFGRFLATLPDSWEVYGSDVSEYAILRARRDCPRGRFALAPAGGDPWPGVRFAVVTAFDVLEHVPDLHEAACMIDAQLLAGGSLVFVVPTYDGLSGPIIRRLDRDPTHVHKWPRGRWLEWAAARFDVVDWLGIVRWLAPGGVYVHVPTRRLRGHAPAILVRCRKRGGA